jgi:prepilin-type N-terminal cleavage/methylation domain-containing protein
MNLLCVHRRHAAFTILEMLASIAILGILMAVIFGIFNQTSRAWMLAEQRVETFQSARLVLEMMSREIETIMQTTNTVGGTGIRLREFNNGSYATGNANVPTSPRNDALFWVGNNLSKSAARDLDLTEYGYIPVFCVNDAITMKGGYYYLLRHQVVASQTNSWDIFSNPNWWNTPVIGTTTKTPILDNVVRFFVNFELLNPANPTNATTVAGTISSSDRPIAVHICMSVLDRRYAARLNALCNGGSLTDAEAGHIPHNLDAIAAPKAALLKEALRTFYRTVYIRNS